QTIAKKTTRKFIFTIAGGTFLLPSGTFWAGVAFDSFGSNITAADFGNFGAGVYNPPTIGSSDDLLFVSSGTGLFKTNNPAGSLGVPTAFKTGTFAQDRLLMVPPGYRFSLVAPFPGPRFLAAAPSGDILVSSPGARKLSLVRSDPAGGAPRVTDFATGLKSPP